MSTRIKGGRPMLDKDIKSGLYQLGRTPYLLRHAYISLKVNDEYVNSLGAIEQYVNLSTIEMRNKFLADLTPLRALPYLTSLNVWRNKLTEVLAFSPPRCENGAMHAPPPSPWGRRRGRRPRVGDGRPAYRLAAARRRPELQRDWTSERLSAEGKLTEFG